MNENDGTTSAINRNGDEATTATPDVPWWWEVWATGHDDLGGFWDTDLSGWPQHVMGDYRPPKTGTIVWFKDSIGVRVHGRNTAGGREWTQATCREDGTTPSGGATRCIMPADHIEVPHFGIGMEEYREGWRPIVERVEFTDGAHV